MFSDIPIRLNGQDVDASWWNTIRTQLVNALGDVSSNYQAPFTVPNNQASYLDVTDAIFDGTENTSWVCKYEVYRKTDSGERIETGSFTVTYKPIALSYSLSRRADQDEDALNITDSLFVNSSGQLQLKSDNMSGASYVGKFSFSIDRIFKGGI